MSFTWRVLVRLIAAVAALAAAATLATLGGCGVTGAAGSAGQVSVVAAFYPLAFVAERVGGDRVEVTNLTPAGAEPHDLELGPQQVATIAEADVVAYERGFQPAVDEVVAQNAPDAALDVTRTVPLRGEDPHLWLDPTRLARVAALVGDTLASEDPDGAAGYRQRADDLARDLRALDREYRDGLRNCRSRVVVTTHDAFGYLTHRYGLDQEPLSGLSPEAEPSPRRLGDVTRLIEDRGVTTIFFETLVSPRTARALAADAGVRTAVLDPLEGLSQPGRDDYFSVMRENLATLRKGLGCR